MRKSRDFSRDETPKLKGPIKAPTPSLRTEGLVNATPPVKKREPQRQRGGSFTLGTSSTLAGNVLVPTRFRNDMMTMFGGMFSPATRGAGVRFTEGRDALREMILSLGA